MYAKFFAIAALVSAVVALPGGGGVSQCNTGPVQCCNTMQSSDHHDVSNALQKGVDDGLLPGINVADVLRDPTVQAGVTCTPIGVIAVQGNSCSSQPVCCTNNSFNGIVALGCTPVNANL